MNRWTDGWSLDSPEPASLGGRGWSPAWTDWAWLMLSGAGVVVVWGGDTSGGRGRSWERGGSSAAGLESGSGGRRAESGRGKVPMPLSRVLIWQLEPEGEEEERDEGGSGGGGSHAGEGAGRAEDV